MASLAAERAFFEGNHCQHVADRDELARRARKHEAMLQVAQLRSRSPLRPIRAQADASHLPLFIVGNEPTLF
jgi:hypothetical protein